MTAELVRVLLFVRDPESRDALRAALRPDEGFVPEFATGGAEPVEAEYDVVIHELDPADAPELSGLARARAAARGRPVIVLVDPDGVGHAHRAVQQGSGDYLITGELHPLLVQRTLRHAVEISRGERRRRLAERALTDSEQRYRSLFEQSRDAIFMTERSGEILEMNRAALDLLGSDSDAILGRNIRSLFAEPGDRDRFRQEMETDGHVRDFEVRLRRDDGSEAWCLVSAWSRRAAGGEVLGYQGIIHDITSRKRVEQQLAHEAFHDSLTGLPNRALFMDRLDRAVARRRRAEERDLAVLFLDLDRFKIVNDSLGHAIGDELLRQMGRLLQHEIREEDTVARIGGDEFAILLDGVDDAADPTHVAERIQERLRKPFQLRGHDVFSSVSIGITFGGADVERAEDLLRDADTAMYRAKDLGPARYQIFDEAMHAHAVTLLQLETDLRLALERREFVVHYQPVMSTSDGRLTGFEALVRWQHPSRGLLAPQVFIPVAEETGTIIPLGEWVLREACRQMRVWQERDSARGKLFVSVNLSARQFDRQDLVETVRNVLRETGLRGESLRLELTESMVMQKPESASQVLKQLRELGVGLCIDDFGTGYSSLHYLHNFPIDTLKIDRTFISQMSGEEGEGGSGIVETILALARNLGMSAIAEGVETEGQLQRLRTLQSASVQGFLFSIPLDDRAAGALLDDAMPVRPPEPPPHRERLDPPKPRDSRDLAPAGEVAEEIGGQGTSQPAVEAPAYPGEDPADEVEEPGDVSEHDAADAAGQPR